MESLVNKNLSLKLNGHPDINDKTRNMLNKRRTELADIIKNAYPPRSISNKNIKDPNFDSLKFHEAVKQTVKAELSIGHLVREYANICKILDPENPMAGDVESIKRP